jgi:hypothetical protein
MPPKKKVTVTKLKKKAWDACSKYVRAKTTNCEHCKKQGNLQAHHYFGRRKLSTMFDENNLVVVCWACHLHWAHQFPEECRDLLIARIGQEAFDTLKLKSNQHRKYTKEDLVLIRKEFEELLKELTFEPW